MRQLSKRAELNPKFTKRIELLIKQLKFNSIMHKKHEHKVKTKKDKRSVVNRTKRNINRIEQDVQSLTDRNSRLRKKLQENLEDKRKLSYYLQELKEAWEIAKGEHPINKRIDQIKQENEKFKG